MCPARRFDPFFFSLPPTQDLSPPVLRREQGVSSSVAGILRGSSFFFFVLPPLYRLRRSLYICKHLERESSSRRPRILVLTESWPGKRCNTLSVP